MRGCVLICSWRLNKGLAGGLTDAALGQPQVSQGVRCLLSSGEPYVVVAAL